MGWGKYGFILKNVKRIKPIPAKGQLNFWEYKREVDGQGNKRRVDG